MFGFGGARGFQLGVVLEAKNLLKGEMRRVKADTDEAKRKLAGLQGQLRQLERYSRGMKIGAGITAAGVGLSMLSVKLVDANKQIEEATATVGLASGKTGKAWEELEPRVRRNLERLTIEHKGSAQDIADAWYRMESVGIGLEAIEGSIDTVLAANVAMRGTAEDTAKAIGMAYTNFKEDLPGKTEADKIKYVADMFAKITAISPQTGPALAGGLSYALPTFKEWNMKLDEGVAVLGLLATRGIEAERAGTAFAATMRQMLEVEDKLGVKVKKNADGTYDLAGTMDALRTKYGENIQGNIELQRKLQETFGDEGKRAIVALWDMKGGLEETTEALRDSAGAAKEMGDVIERTSGSKLERLGDSWRVFKGRLMEDNAVVDHAVDQLNKLMDALNELPDWARTLMGAGVAVGGAAGSVAGPAMTAYNAVMMWRLSKSITGGGIAPVRTFETNPAAIGGAGGVAGTAAKTGFMGKAGIFGIAAGLAVGKVAVDDFLLSRAQKGLFGKEYIAGFGERTKMFGKAAWETGKAWDPLAGKWGYSEEMAKAWRNVWLTETFRTEKVREEKAKEVSSSENVTINIDTINTQAKDGAELASELKKQARRAGQRKSP